MTCIYWLIQVKRGKMIMAKKSKEKTACNNQWARTAVAGSLNDHQEKTEFSNEWVSTNKMATNNSVNTTKSTTSAETHK